MTSESHLAPRWGSGVCATIAGAWLLLSAWLAYKPLQRHLSLFEDGGPTLYHLSLFLLASIPVLATGHHFLRQRDIRRFEPYCFLAVGVFFPLFYEPRAFLSAVWIFAVAYGSGRFALRRLGLSAGGAVGLLGVSTATGLGILSTLLFLLGLAGFLSLGVLAGLLAAATIAFRHEIAGLFQDIRRIAESWGDHEELKHWMASLTVFFAAPLVLLWVMVAAAPSLDFDSLLLHIAPAAHYAARHALEAVPFLEYAYFPQGFEVLMSLAITLGGQHAAQWINPIFLICALALTYAIGRECGMSRGPALAGLGVFFSLPFLHWSAGVSKNDLALAAYLLAGLFCFLRAQKQPERPWLELGCFLVGMSFGVKHVALFGGLPLGVLYLSAAWKRPRRWRRLAVMALVVLSSGLYWHARTFVLTGNPVYPSRLEIVGESVTPDSLREAGAERMWITSIPWAIHFEGWYAFEVRTGTPMGFMLWMFVPLGLLLRGRERAPQRWACFIFAAAYVAYWSASWPILRYAIAPLALLSIFTAERLWRLSADAPRLCRFALPTAAAGGLLYSLIVIAAIEINTSHFSLFAGQIDENQFLDRNLNTWGSLRHVRASQKPEDFTLSVDNCSRAYAPDVTRFHCALMGQNDKSLQWIKRRLSATDYRFLIVPTGYLSDHLAAAVKPAFEVAAGHQDHYYTVFELKKTDLPFYDEPAMADQVRGGQLHYGIPTGIELTKNPIRIWGP